jgi:hypothetical protein
VERHALLYSLKWLLLLLPVQMFINAQLFLDFSAHLILAQTLPAPRSRFNGASSTPSLFKKLLDEGYFLQYLLRARHLPPSRALYRCRGADVESPAPSAVNYPPSSFMAPSPPRPPLGRSACNRLIGVDFTAHPCGSWTPPSPSPPCLATVLPIWQSILLTHPPTPLSQPTARPHFSLSPPFWRRAPSEPTYAESIQK